MERVSNHIESILRMYLETVSETWSLFAHPHDWGLAMQIPPSRRHGQQNASLRIDDENPITVRGRCVQSVARRGEKRVKGKESNCMTRRKFSRGLIGGTLQKL
jgi:hypothetical protein